MICRQSRDRLALALRRYVAGRISNDDLDAVVVDRNDRGAVAVKRATWSLYSDIEVHRATGAYAIDREGRRTIARWVVFLHSDQDYIWPVYSFAGIMNRALNLVTFGWRGRRHIAEAGDLAAWPFMRTGDAEDAAQRPRYFAGRRAG